MNGFQSVNEFLPEDAINPKFMYLGFMFEALTKLGLCPEMEEQFLYKTKEELERLGRWIYAKMFGVMFKLNLYEEGDYGYQRCFFEVKSLSDLFNKKYYSTIHQFNMPVLK